MNTVEICAPIPALHPGDFRAADKAVVAVVAVVAHDHVARIEGRRVDPIVPIDGQPSTAPLVDPVAALVECRSDVAGREFGRLYPVDGGRHGRCRRPPRCACGPAGPGGGRWFG